MRMKTDWLLFMTILGMVSFGLVFVCSSSSVVAEERFHAGSLYFFLRQAGAAVFAFVALMFLAKLDYRHLKSAQWAFLPLGVVVVLLITVYFADPRAHRWLPLGIFTVQPSEFAKPALALFLAWFVTQRAPDINGRHTLLPAAMAMVVLAGAVVVADLGTAVVLIFTAAAVFYVAGLEQRYVRLACLASAALMVVAVIAQPYRLKRIQQFVEGDGTNYQALQSRIAVGSGGLFGQGIMKGNQKLFYLPEAHTDFIYAVVGEELGLFGAALLLAGFVIILWRGTRLYWNALDDFGRYLAVGITVSIVFQALMNMSVALEIAPTKGIPLPLISYGGSSLVSTMLSLGLLLSVSRRAR